MVAQQRYDLRLQVRDLPDSVRIPWLNQFKKILHEGLTRAQLESLHEERNRMDKANGTKQHAVKAVPSASLLVGVRTGRTSHAPVARPRGGFRPVPGKEAAGNEE